MKSNRIPDWRRRGALALAGFVLVLVGNASASRTFTSVHAAAVPTRLTDEQFWNLSKELSEEDGTFRSDNLLSNETTFQYVIPEMLKTVPLGRIYMGVGPEQNFTYIASLKPAMAFIVDIRHGNLDVHLMYKALFEMSADRVDFAFRLFSRKRPDGIDAKATAVQLFNALSGAERSEELLKENLKAINAHLTQTRKFPLSEGDKDGIEWAMRNFYTFGTEISYNSSQGLGDAPSIVGVNGSMGGRRGGGGGETYYSLMTATDGQGQFRSYLANEENFAFLKDLHSRNLLVPVVGNFAGSKAIRAVGKYLKSIDATVSAFYLSNVEQYLNQDGVWDSFCLNAASLPLDSASVFIRTGQGPNGGGRGGVQNSSTQSMLTDLTRCSAAVR